MGQRRQRGAVLCGLAMLGFVACGGATSHGPDDATAGVGAVGVPAVGGASSAGGTPASGAGKTSTTSGTSTIGGGQPEPPSFGGAVELPSAGGTTAVAGGAAPEAGGAAPEAGGDPPNVPSSGGAPNCEIFEQAWLVYFCDTYGDATPDNCGGICGAQVSACLAKCSSCLDCSTPASCRACQRARVLCKARCAAKSTACDDKCIRYGEQCNALETAYPDCERPQATTAP